MIEGLNRLLNRMQHQFQGLDLAAQDLANSSTPGYRGTGFGLRGSGFDRWLRGAAGAHESTGRACDVALPAEVYLKVRTPAGERYTRRGDLRLDQTFRLVLGSGQPVLSADDTEIVVAGGDGRGGSPVSLDDDGTVRAGGKPVARLARYRIPRVLETGGTLFQPAPGAAPEPTEAPLRTGALERSNVGEAEEMSRLTALVQQTRLFGQMATLEDDTLERAFRDLGRSR